MAGISFVSLCKYLSLDKIFIIIQIPAVSRYPVITAHIHGTQPFFTRHQRLIQLFPMTGPDRPDPRIAKQALHGFGKHPDRSRVRFLNKQVSGTGMCKRKLHQLHRFIQIH